MAAIKAPPIDTTDANAPDSQAIQVAPSTGFAVSLVPSVPAPIWSSIHADSGGGQYAYPTASG